MKPIFQPRFERLINRDRTGLPQKIVALLLIVAVLAVVNVHPFIIIAVTAGGVLVLLAVERAQRRRTDTIFAFYISADELLRGEEPRRYRFELENAIKAGDRIVNMMPDPPPLSSFALGALCYSIGDHNGAVQHLALAAEEELLKDSVHTKPSRQLRRYVARLRQIERAPQKFALVNTAMQNLERLHRERGARLLADSQLQLKKLVEAFAGEITEQKALPRNDIMIAPGRALETITAPRPISQVLNEIYQEEANPS